MKWIKGVGRQKQGSPQMKKAEGRVRSSGCTGVEDKQSLGKGLAQLLRTEVSEAGEFTPAYSSSTRRTGTWLLVRGAVQQTPLVTLGVPGTEVCLM